jgi:OmpA-OmpF porin, OOP family
MKRVLFLLISLSFLNGCTVLVKEGAAITEEDVNQCQVGSSVTGTTIGAFASPLGAGAGAVLGALLGEHFCGPVGSAPAPVAAPSDTIYWYDEDGDGVLDADDMCPRTPLGVPVNSSGCAEDYDGDGVPDYLDKCPETPLGNVVGTNGCSLALVTLQGVHFKFDSAALTSEAKSILDRSLAAIKSNPSKNISVEGHTDSTGSDSYNLDLSQRRAESVVKYLVSQGVSGARLNAKGFGESDPVVANDSSSSRAQNRRVEIIAR